MNMGRETGRERKREIEGERGEKNNFPAVQ